MFTKHLRYLKFEKNDFQYHSFQTSQCRLYEIRRRPNRLVKVVICKKNGNFKKRSFCRSGYLKLLLFLSVVFGLKTPTRTHTYDRAALKTYGRAAYPLTRSQSAMLH